MWRWLKSFAGRQRHTNELPPSNRLKDAVLETIPSPASPFEPFLATSTGYFTALTSV